MKKQSFKVVVVKNTGAELEKWLNEGWTQAQVTNNGQASIFVLHKFVLHEERYKKENAVWLAAK